MRLCHCSHLSVIVYLNIFLDLLKIDRVFIFPGGVFIFGAVLKHIQVLSNSEICMGYDSKLSNDSELSKRLYN